MRRFALLLAVVALIVIVPATHAVFAGGVKVDVCHINSANQPAIIHYDYVYDYYLFNYVTGLPSESHSVRSYTATYTLGKVISVDEDAVDAHVAHGDTTLFLPLNDATAALLEHIADGYSDIEYEFEATEPQEVIFFLLPTRQVCSRRVILKLE